MKGFDCYLEIHLEGKTGEKNCFSHISGLQKSVEIKLALKISSLVIRFRFLTVGTTMKTSWKNI